MKIKYISILSIVTVLIVSGFSSVHAQSDVFTQNLYYGLQSNAQVSQLQEFLTSQNLYSGPITGNFYFLTMNAVKAFQTAQGITPAAGYFGPMTMAAANKIADVEVGASNAQAISETGTSTPSTPASSTAQLQLQALLQEVAALQAQMQTQQSSTQAIQSLQTQVQQQTQTIQQQAQTLQQIASNTQAIVTQSTITPPVIPPITPTLGAAEPTAQPVMPNITEVSVGSTTADLDIRNGDYDSLSIFACDYGPTGQFNGGADSSTYQIASGTQDFTLTGLLPNKAYDLTATVVKDGVSATLVLPSMNTTD